MVQWVSSVNHVHVIDDDDDDYGPRRRGAATLLMCNSPCSSRRARIESDRSDVASDAPLLHTSTTTVLPFPRRKRPFRYRLTRTLIVHCDAITVSSLFLRPGTRTTYCIYLCRYVTHGAGMFVHFLGMATIIARTTDDGAVNNMPFMILICESVNRENRLDLPWRTETDRHGTRVKNCGTDYLRSSAR